MDRFISNLKPVIVNKYLKGNHGLCHLHVWHPDQLDIQITESFYLIVRYLIFQKNSWLIGIFAVQITLYMLGNRNTLYLYRFLLTELQDLI